LQPRSVGWRRVPPPPPPIIAARPPLGFRGDDRAGGGADRRADNRSAASPERAADDSAKRAADDRAAEHILCCGLLDRHRGRQPQEYESPQRTDHVSSPSHGSQPPDVQEVLILCGFLAFLVSRSARNMDRGRNAHY